jgi:hypothetical protein
MAVYEVVNLKFFGASAVIGLIVYVSLCTQRAAGMKTKDALLSACLPCHISALLSPSVKVPRAYTRQAHHVLFSIPCIHPRYSHRYLEMSQHLRSALHRVPDGIELLIVGRRRSALWSEPTDSQHCRWISRYILIPFVFKCC